MTKEQFILSKMSRRKKDLGFNIEYSIKGESEVVHKTEDTKMAHPDLLGVFPLFKEAVGKTYQIESPEAGKEDDLYPSIDVISVELPEVKESQRVVIKGELSTITGELVPLKTHKINLSERNYNVEQKLIQYVEILKDEVYAYLFEGKEAQSKLFDAEEQTGKGSKKNKKDEKNKEEGNEKE